MADDESSELSSLSSLSAPPSGDESDIQLERREGILKFFHKKVVQNPELEAKDATPLRARREPSPPHEYVLADNTDIAFIVMFRARFTDALPKSLPNFGPQELERDVVETIPGERVEQFLCAVLGLLLNRKQDVKPGHYGRALEEALQTHKNQWARDWKGQNPLSGSSTFGTMTPAERLTLLRTLIQWTLCSSDSIKAMINQQYKNRAEDDLYIGLSVQPWGSDGDKRRYFLIEGNDDTAFRVYRESNPQGLQRTWWSVAGTIDELKTLAHRLETEDGGPKARALAKRIANSIPRFEATEEKRRRREYRQMRKEQFKRPDNGMSLYEGRTRGKRMKYTYSDDEADFLDSDSANNDSRRSTRSTRNHTPAEPSSAAATTTASGRHVRAPNRLNAETASTGGAPSVEGDSMAMYDGDEDHVESAARKESSVGPTGRPRRTAAVNHGLNGWAPAAKKRKSNEYESDTDEDEGSDPDLGDDEEDDHVPDDEDEDEDEDEEEFEDAEIDEDDVNNAGGGGGGDTRQSLLFKFPIHAGIDEHGKVKLVGRPVTPSSADKQHKHPRAAHAHRNIVESEDSEQGGREKGGGTGTRSTEVDDDRLATEEEEDTKPVEESISVSLTKRPTPESVTSRTAPAPAPASTTASTTTASLVKSPLTPPEVPPSAALAFRGSPDKPQSVAQPIDVGVE